MVSLTALLMYLTGVGERQGRWEKIHMQSKSWHLELGEIGGRFPVLVIPDSGAARKSDGDPISCVRLRFGEFCSCNLPHGSFLLGMR